MGTITSLDLNTNPNPKKKGGIANRLFIMPFDDLQLPGNSCAWAPLGTDNGESVVHVDPFTIVGGTGVDGFRTINQVKLKNNKISAKPIGEEGSKMLRFTAVFTVTGADNITKEWVKNVMNKEFIVLFQSPDCEGTPLFHMLGDCCTGATIDPEFESSTLGEGKSAEWMMTVTWDSEYLPTFSGSIPLF